MTSQDWRHTGRTRPSRCSWRGSSSCCKMSGRSRTSRLSRNKHHCYMAGLWHKYSPDYHCLPKLGRQRCLGQALPLASAQESARWAQSGYPVYQHFPALLDDWKHQESRMRRTMSGTRQQCQIARIPSAGLFPHPPAFYRLLARPECKTSGSPINL